MSAYDDLMARERETQALAQVAGRLGWDQETMMPHGAADQRAEESGAIQAVLHARRVDPARGDVLAQAEAAGATLVKPGHRAHWGGYLGYFSDPDGFLWEVTHNPEFWVGPEDI